MLKGTTKTSPWLPSCVYSAVTAVTLHQGPRDAPRIAAQYHAETPEKTFPSLSLMRS